MVRTSLFGLVILLVGLLVWMLLFWAPAEPSRQGATDAAVPLATAPRGGDFVLNSYRGTVRLSDLRGQVVVLYFGYTSCPDVCPTALAMLSAALDQLSAAEREQIAVLFISVDPERDSLEQLKRYGEYFHPDILGVTGTPEQLSRAAALYGAAYRLVKQESATDYVVDHTADLYLVDRQGELAGTLGHGSLPETILSALRQQLERADP